jgi:maltose alpha-D-glucosyltransferase/alpha-amylase
MKHKEKHWYKRSIFYELFVGSFFDSNQDGKGDLLGVVEKLDYIKWLGIDAIWLSPIYKSSFEDGGYDVINQREIDPTFGSVEDIKWLIKKAHEYEIKIIMDFITGHTAREHPWFQESSKKERNRYSDYYIWNKDDKKYPQARIIFFNTESSNWSYSHDREEYYFHRFKKSQPQLNLSNREVVHELRNIMKYWLDMGVDGFRLDSISMVFCREGTDCEGLPEVHEYINETREWMDKEYGDRILIGEVNDYPNKTIKYFSSSDHKGVHSIFHFILMPRIFMAIKEQLHHYISSIMQETPTPSSKESHWITFLRNHDELTLEKLSQEDRNIMYNSYRVNKKMRFNYGIRRRLAPLLDNNELLIKLSNAIIFSITGSPIIYYGDEIGMGDNIWLQDRDTVRTPMQWDSSNMGGFTKTISQDDLAIPPISEYPYGHLYRNVASQKFYKSSLLHWMRNLISVWHNHSNIFGFGEYISVSVSNPSILAFIREYDEQQILCVNNLSQYPQSVVLFLTNEKDRETVELFGHSPFNKTSPTYSLQLAGYGFYWIYIR